MQQPTVTERALWVYRNEGIWRFALKKGRLLLRSILVQQEAEGSKAARIAQSLQGYLDKGLNHRVIQVGREALADVDSDPLLVRYIGQAFLNLRDFDNARRYFERAALVDPVQGRAISSLAVVEAFAGNMQKAAELFERALLKRDYDAQVFSQWVHCERDSQVRRELLFRALTETGLHSRFSLTWLRELYKIAGSDVAPYIRTSLRKCEVHFPDDVDVKIFLLEFEAREHGLYKIKELLRVENERNGSDRLQCLIIARALQNLAVDGGDEIFEAYRQSLALLIKFFPKDTEAYFELGKLLRNSETTSGYRSFEKSPAKLQALDIFLACSVVGGKAGQQAEVSALEMLQRMRESETLQRNLERMLTVENRTCNGLEAVAALFYRRQRNFEKARTLRLEGLDRDGRTHDHVLALGQEAAAHGNLFSAYAYFEEAQRLRPGVPAIERALAECEFELGCAGQASERVRMLEDRGVSEHWMHAFQKTLEEYHDGNIPAISQRMLYIHFQSRQTESGLLVEAATPFNPEEIGPDIEWLIFLTAECSIDRDRVEKSIQKFPRSAGAIYASRDQALLHVAGKLGHGLPEVLICRASDFRSLAEGTSWHEGAQLVCQKLRMIARPGILHGSATEPGELETFCANC